MLLATALAGPASAETHFSSGLLGEGEPWQTPYYIQSAPREGPSVFVIGGLHGNEPAGAEAAGQIRHWSITRGTLIVVPRANVPALEANARRTPDTPRERSNLNRNFPRTDDEPDATHGPKAEAIWRLVREHQPDWLLDLHEGFDFHVRNSDSVGSSIIHVSDDAVNPYVDRMLEAVNAEVEDEDKRFVPLRRSGPINSGVARAAIAHLDIKGMILETTRVDQPLALRTRQHRLMVHRLLDELDMLDHSPHVLTADRDRYPDPEAPDPEDAPHDEGAAIEVAIYGGPGAGSGGIGRVRRIVEAMPGAQATLVSAEDVQDGGLLGFDAVAFTGGRGGRQGEALGEQGRDALRQFVSDGGGYLGICAGAYLATCRLDDYVAMVRSYHHQPWAAGRGRVEIELTDTGRAWLDPPDAPHAVGAFDVRYANGPLFFHEEGDVPELDLPDFEPLAVFRTAIDTDADAWQQIMVDTPAIVGSAYGQGQVILISPHPESDSDRHWVVENALRRITTHAPATEAAGAEAAAGP